MFGGGGGGWGELFCLLSGFKFYEYTLTLNFRKCKMHQWSFYITKLGNVSQLYFGF